MCPQGAQGLRGCRTGKTHSACHEKRQDKVGGHWQYSALSEIMEHSLEKKTQCQGWIVRMDRSGLGMGKEKKEGREYPGGTMEK